MPAVDGLANGVRRRKPAIDLLLIKAWNNLTSPVFNPLVPAYYATAAVDHHQVGQH